MMQFQSNPYLVWQIISTLSLLSVVVYIQTRPRRKREASELALTMLGGTIWSLANLIQWLSPDFAWQKLWNTVVYLGVLMVPTAWLLFSVRFSGSGIDLIERLGKWLWAVPAVTYVVIISNDIHHLFFFSQEMTGTDGFETLLSGFGPIFYFHTAYSYLLLFLGMVILGRFLVLNLKKYGVYSYGLIVGVLAPLVGNIYFLFGPIPDGFPDPTPFLFGITGIAFVWTIFGSSMLEAVEIAHDSIVQNLSNGIVVLDPDDKILDINPAALNILKPNLSEPIGWSLIRLVHENDHLSQTLAQGLEHIRKNGNAHHSIQIADQQLIHEVVFSPIKDNFGLTTGTLLEFWDISEKVRAEENLASTREAFDITMDALLDSYFEADPAGTITYANRAFATNLGFADTRDVIGKHFRYFTDRRVVRDIFNKFKLLYETKQPLEPFEFHYRTKDGTIYIGETVVSPILLGDEVVGARGMIRDITDRVNAEREIAEQKDLLDGLLQNAPFAIVINDLSHKITVTNPAFRKIFGYSPDEVVGQNLDDLLSTPEIVDEMQAISRSGMEREVYHTGKRRKKDGELVDVDIFAVPFFVNEEKYGNLTFYQDITDRLKAETELEKTQITTAEILDSLQDPYFEADILGKIIFANNALARAVGYERKEDIIGKNFRHITDRKAIRSVFENFQKLYASHEPIEPFNYHYRRKDGQVFIAEIVASPIYEDDQVVGSRGIVRDISVRIEAEEVLRQAKEAAEYRAGELAAINRVAEKVGESLDLDEILQSVCQELATIFEVTNAGVGLLNQESDHLEVVAFYTVRQDDADARGNVISIVGDPRLEELIQQNRTVVIGHARMDPALINFLNLGDQEGPKTTLLVPLLVRGRAIGTISLSAVDQEHRFSENEIELAETIASLIASALENAQLYAQTESALGAAESDLEIGSQIQSGFFPVTIPKLQGWEIATHFHSARQVAGDFYDIFQFKDSQLTAFVIADVCDKGVGAALFMVLIRSLLRAFSDATIEEDEVHDRLLEIVRKTNNYIAEIHSQSNMFATVFFGILDPESGQLHYVNGGHEPPVIMNSQGEVISSLMPTGPAVGLLPNLPFEVEHIQLAPGDILVGFTDGATDARNKAKQNFTEERLIKTISNPWTSVFSMIYELDVELQNHIGGQDQYDDITLISLRRKLTDDLDYHAICRPAEMRMLGELRDFVEEAAFHSGLGEEAVFAFKLSAEEVLTNIIQYGYPDQSPGLIAIAFECDRDHATLKIWDDGLYYPLDSVKTPDLELGWEERKLGGLGVYLIKELMDEVSYEKDSNHQNLLVLEKSWNNKTLEGRKK